MKAFTKILLLSCMVTCFGSTAMAKVIRPSDNYKTEKRTISSVQTVSTLSSIDIVYHQTNGSPFVVINAPDNVMPYIILKEKNGEFSAYYSNDVKINGSSHSRIDVYAPSVNCFRTMSSGDISIPAGIDNNKALKLYSLGSGDIECTSVKCNNFTASVCGSGDIDVKEINSSKIYADINGSGDVNIGKATCKNGELYINASGDMEINWIECKEKLDCGIRASGDMEVAGSCKKASLSNLASGDLDASHMKADEVYADVFGSGDVMCYASQLIIAKSFGSGSLIYSGNPSKEQLQGKHIEKQ